MKHLLSNFATAIICTFFSFWLFKTYYLPPALALNTAPTTANVQLISDQPEAVNLSPRTWQAGVAEDFTKTAKDVTEAVVNITTFNSGGHRMASGSGVIISVDGYIITNNHVIDEGASFEVALHNKRSMAAQLIGRDETTDLALLKINSHDLRTVPFGNSDAVSVGEWVLAVGNPFNLNSTVTAGIVSAKARNISILDETYAIESFIQTDAVVNSGNSGGALVNTQGELIGINTAIMSESGGYEGYSFAIPSNLVRKVANDLRQHGSVKRAILGVRIADVNEEMATRLDLPNVSGVYITDITQGGSAEGAGLVSGDVIVRVNSVNIGSIPQLQEQVAVMRPGDRISVEFYRQGLKYRKDNIILKGLSDAGSTY